MNLVLPMGLALTFALRRGARDPARLMKDSASKGRFVRYALQRFPMSKYARYYPYDIYPVQLSCRDSRLPRSGRRERGPS
jgi:hypothetical protein